MEIIVLQVGSWCAHFPGSDRSVMMRTQRARYERDGERPAQVGCYVQFSSLCYALLTAFFGAIFGCLASCSPGRWLLETFPRFYTCGAVSKEGPSKEMAENTNFIMTLVGWKSMDLFVKRALINPRFCLQP